jgi:hypothetical protein
MALKHPGDTTPIGERAQNIEKLAHEALDGNADSKTKLEKELCSMRNTTSDEYRTALMDKLKQDGSSHFNTTPNVEQATLDDGREALKFSDRFGSRSITVAMSEETDAQRQARESAAAAAQDKFEKALINQGSHNGYSSLAAADALAHQITTGKLNDQ